MYIHMQYGYYTYDFCRIVNGILPGYSQIAKIYVGYQYQCYGTIFIFIIMVVFFRFLTKLGLEMSYGRLSSANLDTLDKLSWILGIILAFGLSYFAFILLNPIFAIIFFAILFIAFIRLAAKK
ncbi:MAG: hypothetical protein QW648_02480 [Nanoarchaeales archaeon]